MGTAWWVLLQPTGISSLILCCSKMRICLLQWFVSHLSCSTPSALPCRCQGRQQQPCQSVFPSLCISEFQKTQSAVDALEAINGWTMKGSELRSRNALAPGHLWRWIWQMSYSNGKQGKHIFYEKMEQLCDSVSVRPCWGLVQLLRRDCPGNQEWLWQKGLLVLEQRSCQGSVLIEQFER